MDQHDCRDINEHVSQRVHQCAETTDELVEPRQGFIFLIKCTDLVGLLAKRTDHAHAGQVLARKPRDLIETRLCLSKERNADDHDAVHDERKNRNRDHKDKRRPHIDRKCHDHRAEHDERAAQEKAQPHVKTCLRLIDIAREARDQRTRPDPIELREGQRFDVVKCRLPEVCAEAGARLRGEPLRREAAEESRERKKHENHNTGDDIRPVISRDADVDDLRDDKRHKQIKKSLEELEERRKNTLLPVLPEVDAKLFHRKLSFRKLPTLPSCDTSRGIGPICGTYGRPRFVNLSHYSPLPENKI